MIGPEKVKFIPWVTYLYNRNYGDNDDSSREKVVKRWNLYLELMTRPVYDRIQAIDFGHQNEEV